MSVSEAETSLAESDAKSTVDVLVGLVWEASALQLALRVRPASCSVWSCYEILQRTQFQALPVLGRGLFDRLVDEAPDCTHCQRLVRTLVTRGGILNREYHMSDHACLIRWKREMRSGSTASIAWPTFGHTLLMVKPGELHRTSDVIDRIRPAKVIARRTRVLSARDIQFLYSTAFGREFVSRQLAYYSSGPVEFLLVSAPNAVGLQGTLKAAIRGAFSANDPMRNVVHAPDSLAECYADLGLVFGKRWVRSAIRATIDAV